MNPRVVAVKPIDNYCLELVFTNQERKRFDVKPYLGIGLFEELRDLVLFNGIQASHGSIRWPNDLDLDPDTLYLDSQPVD
ncbi:DUF2442 domain-containing protein [Fibrella arboris]|uniref:DUF2442 domain-containing protein n=1 Tax=Fibrella arboris TaxID=3242486 RepID=UPI0035213722